jgi:hypothetical protein
MLSFKAGSHCGPKSMEIVVRPDLDSVDLLVNSRVCEYA